MLTIEITGPQGSGKTKTAQQIASMLQSNGKIVRVYDEEKTLGEYEVARCDVAIIVKQETSNGSSST
jgi:RecA/RadA recombinase